MNNTDTPKIKRNDALREKAVNALSEYLAKKSDTRRFELVDITPHRAGILYQFQAHKPKEDYLVKVYGDDSAPIIYGVVG